MRMGDVTGVTRRAEDAYAATIRGLEALADAPCGHPNHT